MSLLIHKMPIQKFCYYLKTATTMICIFTSLSLATSFKNNKFLISAGLNQTFFQYDKSESYFSNAFHINPCLNISFQHQISNIIGFSIGIDYCILGGKKDFDFYDSVFVFDSSTMTYQYSSIERFKGNFNFNFPYYNIPILITSKICRLPIEFALGPTLGFITKEELQFTNHPTAFFEYIGSGKATPVKHRNQFHSRILSSVKWLIPLNGIEFNVGLIYSYELTEIETKLSSRRIQNTNEFRTYLSVVIPKMRAVRE